MLNITDSGTTYYSNPVHPYYCLRLVLEGLDKYLLYGFVNISQEGCVRVRVRASPYVLFSGVALTLTQTRSTSHLCCLSLHPLTPSMPAYPKLAVPFIPVYHYRMLHTPSLTQCRQELWFNIDIGDITYDCDGMKDPKFIAAVLLGTVFGGGGVGAGLGSCHFVCM